MWNDRLTIPLIVLCTLPLLPLYGCSGIDNRPSYNPKTCLEDVPKTAAGVRIIHGPRGERNVLYDMQTVYCNAQMLFKLMNEKKSEVSPGEVLFQVTVEYTGEVSAVEVLESSIVSALFLRRIKDMIMDTDFSPWMRGDEDTRFDYPMSFNNWWEK